VELREEANRIWSSCEGFPGVEDENAFASWILDHHVKTTFFFAAYGDATVGDVRNSLAAHEQLLRFVLKSESMTPAERLDAFRTEFPA
ncbi:MAG: hypothetical protein M3141_09000, partial [Actinomycetota bacterium]|nr:hypothetical protein [Actinomycetota bacterium]